MKKISSEKRIPNGGTKTKVQILYREFFCDAFGLCGLGDSRKYETRSLQPQKVDMEASMVEGVLHTAVVGDFQEEVSLEVEVLQAEAEAQEVSKNKLLKMNS